MKGEPTVLGILVIPVYSLIGKMVILARLDYLMRAVPNKNKMETGRSLGGMCRTVHLIPKILATPKY